MFNTYEEKLDKVRRQVQDANNKARGKGLPRTLKMEEWLSCLNYWNWSCAACGTNTAAITLDHLISVNTPGNPGTVASNVIPLCFSCNRAKQDSSFESLVRRNIAKYISDDLSPVTRVQEYIALVSSKGVADNSNIPDAPLLKAHIGNAKNRPKRQSIRFELSPENPDHVILHDYLETLARSEQASEWMRQSLLFMARRDRANANTTETVENAETNATRLSDSPPANTDVSDDYDESAEPRYVDPDE